MRPFDLSVLFDHMLGEAKWRSPLTRLGFVLTFVQSTPKFSTRTAAAQKMKSMANSLEVQMTDGQAEQQTEDLRALRQLLDSLSIVLVIICGMCLM